MKKFQRYCRCFLITLLGLCLANLALGTEPKNHDEYIGDLVKYHDDGSYAHDLMEVSARVIAYLRERAPKASKPALVLDIDETSLSNWSILRANQFAFFAVGPCDHLPNGPCGEDTWEKLGIDPALESTLDIYRAARSAGVKVFFITGRKEPSRSATEQNLRNAGYSVWERLIMAPEGSHFASAADYKAPEREKIERDGYTIIANVGDQKSDLVGGHAEQGFRLPNPFYLIP
jgi:predicted secreted acid phosphatase